MHPAFHLIQCFTHYTVCDRLKLGTQFKESLITIQGLLEMGREFGWKIPFVKLLKTLEILNVTIISRLVKKISKPATEELFATHWSKREDHAALDVVATG